MNYENIIEFDLTKSKLTIISPPHLTVLYSSIQAREPRQSIGSPLQVMILHQNCNKIVKIDSKHHKLANYISNTDNCERATRLPGRRNDVYSKYHKVGNSFNFLKYTHTQINR